MRQALDVILAAFVSVHEEVIVFVFIFERSNLYSISKWLTTSTMRNPSVPPSLRHSLPLCFRPYALPSPVPLPSVPPPLRFTLPHPFVPSLLPSFL